MRSPRYNRGVLRDIRRLAVPELDAFHEEVWVRSRHLRVGVQRGRNVASDHALVQRAAPFLHQLTRPQLVILLEGTSRFDEQGRRRWFDAGDLALSDAAQAGIDAFGGATSRLLVLTWDPDALGLPFAGEVRVAPLGRRDRARLDLLSRGLTGPRPAQAIAEIIAVLRAAGVGLAPVTAAQLEAEPVAADDQRVHAAFVEQLGDLERRPAIGELAQRLGTTERHVHRRLRAFGERYATQWTQWRAALHHARILTAVRLLAAPGATTERVARLCGYGAPSALCHAFERGGLPSPGALARAARRDVLDRWAEIRSAA